VALDDTETSVMGKFIEAHYIALFHLQSAHNFTCCGSEWIILRCVIPIVLSAIVILMCVYVKTQLSYLLSI
jgi:hypothetical protein